MEAGSSSVSLQSSAGVGDWIDQLGERWPPNKVMLNDEEKELLRKEGCDSDTVSSMTWSDLHKLGIRVGPARTILSLLDTGELPLRFRMSICRNFRVHVKIPAHSLLWGAQVLRTQLAGFESERQVCCQNHARALKCAQAHQFLSQRCVLPSQIDTVAFWGSCSW
jgi:hypothetical protein